jgi:Tfp pilus assembly protein PilW
MNPTSERGLTLTELTVVMVLAGLVTIGLVTFYLNSQGMWLDASSQALTQRDATLLLERMTSEARGAAHATVVNDPDAMHQTLIFFEIDGATERSRFSWNGTDSLVHLGLGPGGVDKGPVTTSRVREFRLDSNDTLVFLRALKMSSTTGQPVELASTMALYNK